MATYRFHFLVTTPSWTIKTSTVRETDNQEAALREMYFIFPEATEIIITKHYRKNA